MSTVYANTLVLKGDPSVEITSQTMSGSNVSVLRSAQQLTFSGNSAQTFNFLPATSSSLSSWVEFNDVGNNFTFKEGMHIINAQVHVTRPLCTQTSQFVGTSGTGSGFANTTVTDNATDNVKVAYLPEGPGDGFVLRERPYIVNPIRVEFKAKSDGNTIGQSITYLSPTIDSQTNGSNFVEPVTFNMILSIDSDKAVTFELAVADKAVQTGPLSINSFSNTSLMYVNSFSS